MRGGVDYVLFYLVLLFCLCILCHSIVGLVPCLCDGVVSLWNSGDGLCGAEGRVVFTVYCQLFMYCVAGCGMAVCGSMCECVWFRRLFSSSLPLPLPLCVGVRGSARAALRARTLSPNTIAFPLLFRLLCPSSFFVSRLSSPLFHFPPFLLLWNGGGGFTMCRSVVLA